MRDAKAARNAEAVEALEARGVEVVELDVTDQASVDRAAEHILREAVAIDVLVNNAGTGHMGVIEAFTPEALERQLATNLVGPHRLDRAFLPGMRQRRSGLVVFIGSVIGRFTAPIAGVYSASKYALEAMAESLSYELRPLGIDVAIVEPGAYETSITSKFIAPDDSERQAEYPHAQRIIEQFGAALTDAGDPNEVADAVLELVKLPAGTRPLRTVVPADHPTAAINASVAPIQRGIIEHFGFRELLPNEKAPAAAG